MGPQTPPQQPDSYTSSHGGATPHAQNQWILMELTKLIASNAVLAEKISTHNDDLKEIKTDVKKINNKILIASTVVVVAGAFATFFFGSSLSEIMDSLNALKDTSTK